jgi:hypothetical protein
LPAALSSLLRSALHASRLDRASQQDTGIEEGGERGDSTSGSASRKEEKGNREKGRTRRTMEGREGKK